MGLTFTECSGGGGRKVDKGVEVVEVIEGTSLPLLGHLDDLDTLVYLCFYVITRA
jgi:hypothetical protein